MPVAAAPLNLPPVPAGSVPQGVEAPAKIDLNPQTLETQRVKAEVLKRVDLVPGLSGEEKDKLYVAVDRARAMGRVITVPFGSGRTELDEASISAIGDKLALDQVRKLTDDPTVVFVVLGYADKNGDPKKNLEISQTRADAVLSVLKSRYNILNVMHSVGMGGSEMFDSQNLDKNRVAEIWAVLP
jgi:outer membrane protein OmpA-like peptidoglycan-associated protein